MDNDLILYTTDDGESQLVLRELGGQVWLTQLEMAELYQTSKHVKAVLSDGGLAEGSVVNSKFTTAADGKEYLTQLYVLPKKLQERLEQKRKDKNDHPSGPQIPENIQCQVASASWLEFRS